ncbi:UPF0103-domain-containing protein [Tilletiopsis washingtonensis]|uniref:UPF0103-domain-containing protein n=1 Tax=Tilletiopsis washingtonensis TaxID=58919 RepID=A0A316ZCN3_9BASI|nr:UPF0103-domain-containing protein [Tilletiopsis washingtonensis]PWN98045.1 UPF0103-domain-containing protein [Tilletiopsis washingtonensis]
MTPRARTATHAGSWYEADAPRLGQQLEGWLARVDASQIPPPGRSAADMSSPASSNSSAAAPLHLPADGAKAVIAPHAGYSYSGPAAAWAYAAIPTSAIKRVFVLGPSHHVYLDGCALSKCATYKTPLGDLPLDLETIAELRASGEFSDMSQDTDEQEHSIELHLPYIRHVWKDDAIKIVPILIGSISSSKEAHYGQLLAPYLADSETFFVVSSDFCHWGQRFSYTRYEAAPGKPVSLSSRVAPAPEVPIHTSIRRLDARGMAAITFPARESADDAADAASSSGDADGKTASEAQSAFRQYLKDTRNTICGRHPIGVLLGALSALEEAHGQQAECRFTRYEQSSQCLRASDSSVSYASAVVRFL